MGVGLGVKVFRYAHVKSLELQGEDDELEVFG